MPMPRKPKVSPTLAESQLQELRIDLTMNRALTQILEWQATFAQRFDNLERSIETLIEQHQQNKEVMELRVRALEDWRTEFRGSWKVIVALSAFVGWLVSFVASHVQSWVGK